MRLENIYAEGSTIIVFSREDNGELKANRYTGFLPYYYEPAKDGTFKSYYGEPLRRMIVSDYRQIYKDRSPNAYNADIRPTIQFIIDKVDTIDKAPIRTIFFDIEVRCSQIPNPKVAKDPISCITTYDSFTKETKTWWLPDYKSEYELLKDFILYIRKIKPTLLTAWNVEFDYVYLSTRTKAMFQDRDFASIISPIGKNRYGYKDEDEEIVYYPVGIAILDYMELVKKLTLNREKNYTLDYIAQKYLGCKANEKVDFNSLDIKIKEKNIQDVLKMAQIDDQKRIIDYFDNVRRLCKVAEWESVIHNSRCIDSLILAEAKIKGVAVPMQPVKSNEETEDEDEIKFEGAYRKLIEGGLHREKVWELDISSAYPSAIIDFCLDPANASNEPKENSIKIDNTYFIQNSNAVIPAVVKKVLTLKNNISKQLKTLKVGTKEYEDMEVMYASSKGIANSTFGVCGFRAFRLFDPRVAGGITFIVRSLLHYIESKLNEIGCKVIYIDTDAVKVVSDIDRTEQINSWVKDWAKETFNKDNVNITFENKGYYESLFLVAMCRYIGRLRKPNGELQEELKGLQSKRNDASNYCKTLQPILLNKILDGNTKEDIVDFLKKEIENFKNQDLLSIAIPCKVNPNKKYKYVPIFVRALKNTPEFEYKMGENFYYVYMEGLDTEKKEAVKAFDEHTLHLIDKDKINWKKMLERNLLNMVETIFEALKYDIKDVYLAPEKPKRIKKETISKHLTNLDNNDILKSNMESEKQNKIKDLKEQSISQNLVKDDIFD